MNSIKILNIPQFEQDKQLKDFYCNRFSDHINKNIDLIKTPHKHNFYLCVVFTHGSGTHEIDFNSYEIKPGSVFFLKPGQTHFWKFNSAPEGYIFFHSQEFYKLLFSTKTLDQFPFYDSYKNSPGLNLDKNNLETITAHFENIYQEFHQNLPYKSQQLASLLNTTYIDLARNYSFDNSNQSNTSTRYLRLFRTLENVIETYFKTEKSAKFYANELNITSKHLNRITKITINKTTTELITERVLLEAKRLIVHSDIPLARVAETLGYEDYAYFSKVFKLKTKSTPMEFKKSYLMLK